VKAAATKLRQKQSYLKGELREKNPGEWILRKNDQSETEKKGRGGSHNNAKER